MENEEFRPVLPKKLYSRIEENVVNLHIELGLDIPINPMDVAKKLGFYVKKFSELHVDEAELNLLRIGNDGKRRDGLSYYDREKSTYVIWINDIDSLYEEHDEFTVMHEIGHIRMGHKGDSQLAEMIANYYAAYSFVPSPLPEMMNCHSFIEIADVFHVSMECAYNCSKRCMNWAMYFGTAKEYEKRLRNYYQKKMKGCD